MHQIYEINATYDPAIDTTISGSWRWYVYSDSMHSAEQSFANFLEITKLHKMPTNICAKICDQLHKKLIDIFISEELVDVKIIIDNISLDRRCRDMDLRCGRYYKGRPPMYKITIEVDNIIELETFADWLYSLMPKCENTNNSIIFC